MRRVIEELQLAQGVGQVIVHMCTCGGLLQIEIICSVHIAVAHVLYHHSLAMITITAVKMKRA